MASWRGLRLLLGGSTRRWERPFPQSDQSLRIDAAVLRHLRRHRQVKSSAREAGGQLYGRVTNELVTVSHTAGPHASDERGRFAFRSDPQRAQADIERFAGRRLLYLGEWHTHAEAVPHASASDEHAMRQIYVRSQLNTAALLLVIVGFAKPDEDIGVWYIDAGGLLRSVARNS